jgi:hypothetical protein
MIFNKLEVIFCAFSTIEIFAENFVNVLIPFLGQAENNFVNALILFIRVKNRGVNLP